MAALAALFALSSCASADPGSERETDRSRNAISGDNAHVDDYGVTNPWIASVGYLQLNYYGVCKLYPPPPSVCPKSRSCTGTLISPQMVLTAGHCFDGADESNLGEFTLPNQPPSAHGTPLGHTYTIVDFHRINNFSDSPHDIALAVLKAPGVPSSVLAHYLPIALGNLGEAAKTGTLRRPGYIAGFGGTVPSEKNNKDEPEDGHRRYGDAPGDLGISKDPCDKLVGEGPCNNDWEIEANRVANPEPEKGDSGGPLILTATEPYVHLVIAGVDSGVVYDFNSTPRSVWASTANPGGLDNGKWIIEHLGGDADGDGIPETADNCPAWVCQHHPSGCANPDQADVDGDGVGDACDNCPPAWCAQLAARYGTPSAPFGMFCKNPTQLDFDKDGLGDACDLCPENGSDAADPAADSDRDGIGDVCDTCDQQRDGFPGCYSSANCHNGFCITGSGIFAGRCSEPADEDDDGVPDGCDECPSFKSPDRTNSNDLAEEREHDLVDPNVTMLADPCDAVPLERFQQHEPDKLDQDAVDQLVAGDAEGPDDIAAIDENEWLGQDINHPSASTTVQRRVAYRYCPCIGSSGQHLPLDQCVGEASGSIICPDNMPLTDGHWKTPTIVNASGFEILDTSGTTLPFFQQGFRTGTDFGPHTVFWRWRHDSILKGIQGEGDCLSGGPLDCGSYGALLTRTVKAAPYASTREENHTLGDVFGLITTPSVTRVPDLPGAPNQPGSHGAPLAWMTTDYVAKPPYLGFTNMFTHPAPIAVQPSGEVVAFPGSGKILDVTRYFGDVAQNLLSTDVQWLSAVEPFDVARYSASWAVQNGLHAVVLQRDYTGLAPVPMAITDSGVRAHIRVIGDGDPPPVLHDVHGAYSAVESNVYMVGGTLDSGRAENGVWRFNLPTLSWHFLDVGGSYVPSSRVLSVGYDPSGRHLYVLDVDDDDVRAPRQRTARLYRIDLDGHASTLLHEFRYHDTGGVRAIAVMPDGLLALVVGHGHAFTVWRLDGRGDHAAFKGVLGGAGQALGGPVMGEDRLYMPVSRAGKVDVIALSSDRFHGGPPCTSL